MYSVEVNFHLFVSQIAGISLFSSPFMGVYLPYLATFVSLARINWEVEGKPEMK